MGFLEIVKPPLPGHKCDQPYTHPEFPDFLPGTKWECDVCGEKWELIGFYYADCNWERIDG